MTRPRSPGRADELAKQEERYRKQADLLQKNGLQPFKTNEAAVARVADQVDRLGIQYDREAEALKAKQDLVTRRAKRP